LAQKYGGKHVFGVGIFLTAVLTLLTPIAARIGPAYMIGVRVLEGIGEVSVIRNLRQIIISTFLYLKVY